MRLALPRIAFSAAILFLPVYGENYSAQQSTNETNTNLVMLTVTVRIRSGEYATGVNREAFQILDEKETRPIAFFESGDENPSSVGILIDTSSSMQLFERKDVARPAAIGEALCELLQAGNPNNEYFLAAFDANVRFLTDWRSSESLLAEKTAITQEKKNTALYDACFTAIQKFETSHHARKALILVSDGQDNLSRHSFNELRDLLKKSDVTFYAIGILTGSDMGSVLGIEGGGILTELSEVTGGQALFPRDKKEMRQAMNLVVTQLRHQYRLGFNSGNGDRPNKWHRLKVRIALPSNAPPEFRSLNIQVRQGYYTR